MIWSVGRKITVLLPAMLILHAAELFAAPSPQPIPALPNPLAQVAPPQKTPGKQ